MKIIYRNGSQRIIQDNNGKFWLTRRKKRRHDSRRTPPHISKKPSVINIPLQQLSLDEVEIMMGNANHRCEDGHYPDINFTP